MIENNPTNVASAFDMLLEELESEIDLVNGIGSKAFEKRDYDKVKEAHERAANLTVFRDRVATLRKEWEDFSAAAGYHREEQDPRPHLKKRRLQRGLRTPETAFYRPILQVLDEIGGTGKMADVLDKVGMLMKQVLKEVDFLTLNSTPNNPRWRNTAQWARNSMVYDGLLKFNSPHGVWEITNKGRALLKDSHAG